MEAANLPLVELMDRSAQHTQHAPCSLFAAMQQACGILVTHIAVSSCRLCCMYCTVQEIRAQDCLC